MTRIYPLLRRISVLSGILLNQEKLKELEEKDPEYWDITYPLNDDCIQEVSLSFSFMVFYQL